MPKHETKNCARCGKEFECKSGSVLLCQCQTIYSTPNELDYISSRYEDCLCVSCLKRLKADCGIRALNNRIETINAADEQQALNVVHVPASQRPRRGVR